MRRVEQREGVGGDSRRELRGRVVAQVRGEEGVDAGRADLVDAVGAVIADRTIER